MAGAFTRDQEIEIEAGKEAGIDVSIYAKPEFLGIQMHQIRLGLEEAEKWEDRRISKDQMIAYYHSAKKGSEGKRINGDPIPAVKGNELPPLKGQGFLVRDDGKTYIATKDNKIAIYRNT